MNNHKPYSKDPKTNKLWQAEALRQRLIKEEQKKNEKK
jgi:hypothetical protein